MKKIKNLILLSFLAIICAGCPDYCENGHQYISFVNKSDKEIGYQPNGGRISNINQDTIMILCPGIFNRLIPKDSIFELPCVNDCWEIDLANEDYIQFLVLDGEKFTKYYRAPCDSVRKYVPILDCYRLTLEDLQRMNWTVVYPPEEQNNIEP